MLLTTNAFYFFLFCYLFITFLCSRLEQIIKEEFDVVLRTKAQTWAFIEENAKNGHFKSKIAMICYHLSFVLLILVAGIGLLAAWAPKG